MELQKEPISFKVCADVTELNVTIEKLEYMSELLERVQKQMEQVRELSDTLPKNITE